MVNDDVWFIRSTTGTYNLLDENFRNTASTISLYIRISCFGKCLVTEITRLESGAFCVRREPDEEQYLSRQLTEDELQSGRWDAIRDLSLRVPRGRLVCRCEELIRKEDAAANLAGNWFSRFVYRERIYTTLLLSSLYLFCKRRERERALLIPENKALSQVKLCRRTAYLIVMPSFI